MALKKRPAPNGPGISLGDPWDDPGFQGDYPNVYSFLFDTKYEDGSPRAPGSISIFVSGYALKFAVNDKDRQCVAFVNAGTFFELLQMVEDGIRDDNLDWKAAAKPVPGKVIPF